MWGVGNVGLQVLESHEVDSLMECGAFFEWSEKTFTLLDLFRFVFGKSNSELRKDAKGGALRFGGEKITFDELNTIERIDHHTCNFAIIAIGKKRREMVVFNRSFA